MVTPVRLYGDCTGSLSDSPLDIVDLLAVSLKDWFAVADD
jgi:hypothetical protein